MGKMKASGRDIAERATIICCVPSVSRATVKLIISKLTGVEKQYELAA